MTATVTAARAATLELAPVWHAAGRAAVEVAAGDLVLEACVVPWDTAARVTDDGRTFYDETWAPGSLVPNERVVIYDGHVPAGGGPGRLNADRQAIGRADGFDSRPDGLWATLTLANTARGRDVYELARTLGYVDVSLETDVPMGGRGTVARTAAEPCALTGIAVVLPPGRGAFPGALAAAARAAGGDEDDDETTDDDDADATPVDPDAPPAETGRADLAEVVRRELARYGGRPAGRAGGGRAGPLARFDSFRGLVTAAREARDDRAAELNTAFTSSYHTWRELDALARQGTVGRALLDQVTLDNPGLMPPTWLTEVFGIVDRGRPGITALGGPRSPGSAGMDIYWPYYDGDLLAIVAKQLTQKSAINSVKVSFKRGSATLDTYAGGSDVAFQLIRRSSPAYLALYNRILNIAFGQTTEFAFDAVIGAGAGVTTTYDLAADTDGAALRAVLFAASAAVRDATGEPASVVLAAPDVFAALGSAPWLLPPQYGTQNISGTASASTLRVNISGLEMTEAPGLAAGTMIVTNAGAAAWFEDGPFIVTADDVEKLGTNVAIWGMGTPGLFLPAGIVEVTVTLPPVVPLTRREVNVDRAMMDDAIEAAATDADAKATAKSK
jgi:hypothetical protein